MINGVIFDMDGTMFDTERMWATFWDPALKALGLPYKEGLAEAARGTAGETTRNVVRSFYGPDCDADGIVESLHRVADEVFLSAPVPKKPGLDALLAWLDEQRLPMAVASSSREAMIRNNLDQWGMTHYFKAIVSGQHVAHSKPDPEIFLLTAEKLGVEPVFTVINWDNKVFELNGKGIDVVWNGMTITDEPGVYETDEVGIRIENELECVDAGTNQYGHWLKFEPLTLVPISTEPVIVDELTRDQINWLNAYHAHVYEMLSPRLTEEEKTWLKAKTAPIDR